MRRPVRPRLPIVVTLVAALLVAGCTDDEPTTANPNDRLIEVYATSVAAIADDAGPRPGPEDDRITVFLVGREDDEINADVQVGVVQALEEWANVRFIDAIEEAVDADADDQPVRNDGLLIGLGQVSGNDAQATLTADRYVTQGSTFVYDLSLARRGGEWTIDEPLHRVTANTP